MLTNIILDFKNVKDKYDVFDVFEHAFKFAYPPRGFDSLIDSLDSLDTESEVYIKHSGHIKITMVHDDDLQKRFPEFYEQAISILKKYK
jgi:RNAse (barnase) inhibitor barstar